MVIGSGGREHAICYKLALSTLIDEVICVPGNGGTAQEQKCRNITGASSIYDYVNIAKNEACDFVVVGPEVPLSQGVSDALAQANIMCVGPQKKASMLEASKDFAKSFMQKYDVARAESKTFDKESEAIEYIKARGVPIVIKADGLAAGKGVVVAKTQEEATEAVHAMLKENTLGDAGKKLVIEEYLTGNEVSILAAVSCNKDTIKMGKSTIKPFITARDHKRLLDGANGPNTGGMGAIAPVPDITQNDLDLFQKNILEPTLKGLIAEDMDYRGFIFFGLMLTQDGPKALEYNVRLGDPETQAVLPLMKSDFAALCKAIINGTLCDFSLEWEDAFVAAPVAVSQGYPKAYQKGKRISIDRNVLDNCNTKVFIAGAMKDKRAGSNANTLVTNGGRVLCASAKGKTLDEARLNAYAALKAIDFDGIFYRTDIGLPGAAKSE